MPWWSWLALWVGLAFCAAGLLGPVMKAHMAGRPMTDKECSDVAWAGAGIFMGLFIFAAFFFGIR